MANGGGNEESREPRTRSREALYGLAPADRIDARAHVAAPAGGELPVLAGDDVLVFASENALGLTADEHVVRAATRAAETVGTGAGSPRRVAGDTLVHHDLERQLAEVTRTDRVRSVPSVHAALLGTVEALDPDVVFADERRHPGVADGCRLVGATVRTYDHGDPTALERRLETALADRGDDQWLIVTPSISPTDGTVTPLSTLGELGERHDARLCVDESAAIGLYADGAGVVGTEGLHERVDVQVGSLGGALAAQGGFVAGSETVVEAVLEQSGVCGRSTALPPTVVAAASEALHRSRHGDCRERLWENVAHLRDGLEAIGLEPPGEAHLLPVPLESHDAAVALAAASYDRDVLVEPPPLDDGAPGADRIVVRPTAAHTDEDVVSCLEAIEDAVATLDGG